MTRASLLLLVLATAAVAQEPAPAEPPAAAETPAPAATPANPCEQALAQAQAGDPQGMLQVADCYMGAAPGLPKDPALALQWYERASDLGVPRATRAFTTTSLLTGLQKSEEAKAKARRRLEDILRKDPNDAHVLFILGVDQYARGAYDVSVSSLKQASEFGSLQATALLGCLSRSCRQPACGAIKPESHYQERFAKAAAKLKSTLDYRTMATQLRKQLLIGEACAAIAGG